MGARSVFIVHYSHADNELHLWNLFKFIEFIQVLRSRLNCLSGLRHAEACITIALRKLMELSWRCSIVHWSFDGQPELLFS